MYVLPSTRGRIAPIAYSTTCLACLPPTTPLPAFVTLKTDALIVAVYSMKVVGCYKIYFSESVESDSFGYDAAGIKASVVCFLLGIVLC